MRPSTGLALASLTGAFLFALSAKASGIAFVPTTTLATETGNNTSAADSYAGWSNGNLPATNVSKVSVKTLLYPGSTTKVYAHLLGWWGTSSHKDIGYSSSDPAQVKRQVADLVSRGCDGGIVDWYGPGSDPSNLFTQHLKTEAEARTGFEFAIMEDKGAVKSASDPTAKVISDLGYAYATYEDSPAYMRRGGRPVVLFFGVESLAVDWTKVRASVPGDPIFVFENSGGFTRPQAGGAFSWVAPSASHQPDLGYLSGFYLTGLKDANELTIGSVYKGFDDSMASWGMHRLVEQNAGQTWLETFGVVSSIYSAHEQLDALELVTWNDYEEGTELETGIENGVSVALSAQGTKLSWTLPTGSASTLDHFTVFVSTDGQNLMPLPGLPVPTTSLDVASLGLPAGSYVFYVKAVGKPFIRNHTSAAVKVALGAAPPPPPPPTTSTVEVVSPTNGSTVSTSCHVVAVPHFAKQVTTMKIYVDSKDVFTTSAGKIDTTVQLAAGKHEITCQGWDWTGGVFKTTVTVTGR